jgi:hypothetical protein
MNVDTLNEMGGISQGLNSFANAFSEISQSDFIAQQFKFNEQLAGIQSEEAITQGTTEQEISQEKNAQLSCQQVVAEAAQGVDVHTGTAELTRQQTGEIGGKDYLTLGNNAFLKSLGYKIAGLNDESQAGMQQTAGINKAENTLLGGATEMFQSSMKAVAYDQQAKQAGTPTNKQLDSAS